jgi:RNA polymerase sigma-70 factor (ECF subfamily)
MDQNRSEEAMGSTTLAVAQDGQVAPGRPADPDGDVVEAVRRGDARGAVALCARRHGEAIGRLCMAMVGSVPEAQDLAQETLLAAHEALGAYRAEGTVRAYLFGIARRLCARHLEMRARRESRLRLVHDAHRDGADLADQVAARQRAERARGALERLRPSERDAVVLRFQSELSFRDVAEACGIDEPAARKRVSRALAHLRETLGQS